MSTELIQQGLNWLASNVRDNLGLTIVGFRGIEFEDEFTVRMDIRIAEFDEDEEDEYYKGVELEKRIGSYLRTLPPNYYPPQIKFYASVNDKGWSSVWIYYVLAETV